MYLTSGLHRERSYGILQQRNLRELKNGILHASLTTKLEIDHDAWLHFFFMIINP